MKFRLKWAPLQLIIKMGVLTADFNHIKLIFPMRVEPIRADSSQTKSSKQIKTVNFINTLLFPPFWKYRPSSIPPCGGGNLSWTFDTCFYPCICLFVCACILLGFLLLSTHFENILFWLLQKAIEVIYNRIWKRTLSRNPKCCQSNEMEELSFPYALTATRPQNRACEWLWCFWVKFVFSHLLLLRKYLSKIQLNHLLFLVYIVEHFVSMEKYVPTLLDFEYWECRERETMFV